MKRIISEDLLNAVIDDLSQLSEGGGLDELLVQLRCLPHQPHSGQVGEALNRPTQVIDLMIREDRYPSVIRYVERLERALRQPVETGGMTLEQWVRMDDLRTQPQAPVVDLKQIAMEKAEIHACRENLSQIRDMATDARLDGMAHRLNSEIARLYALLQSRKEPVVEVPSVEEILLAIGDDPDHPLKSAIRVHALLQSKGGR